MIILTDTKKDILQNPTVFRNKNVQQTRNGRNTLQPEKTHSYVTSMVTIILNVERLN